MPANECETIEMDTIHKSRPKRVMINGYHENLIELILFLTQMTDDESCSNRLCCKTLLTSEHSNTHIRLKTRKMSTELRP